MALWEKGRENVTNCEKFDMGASYLYQESISFLITDCNNMLLHLEIQTPVFHRPVETLNRGQSTAEKTAIKDGPSIYLGGKPRDQCSS